MKIIKRKITSASDTRSKHLKLKRDLIRLFARHGIACEEVHVSFQKFLRVELWLRFGDDWSVAPICYGVTADDIFGISVSSGDAEFHSEDLHQQEELVGIDTFRDKLYDLLFADFD